VFEGDSAAVIARIVEDTPAPVSRHRPETPRELDSILARALEKNPGRRYRNLEQLRRALLPHASGGMTSASIWLRLAAYMIDTSAVMLLLVVAQVVAVMLNTLTGGTEPTAGQTMQDQHARSILVIGLYVLYFTIAEGQLGRGVGKALFGLRVVRLDGERAGLGRALLRACILPGGLGLPALAAVALLLRQTGPGVSQPLTVSVQDQVLAAVINSSVPLLALLCMLTIRARNGYRGLHELASGTRVVYTPRPRLVQALAVPVPPVQPSERQGEVFGPYRVEGRLGRMAGAELLVARDRQLHRSVWVRVHDGVEAPAVERRNLARATRVRWLQGGVVDGSRWDAYQALEGAPLTACAAWHPQLPWSRTRTVLLDLARELVASQEDGTLPAVPGLDQLWMDGAGRLKVLDAPVVQDAGPSTAPAGFVELLRHAAALLVRSQILPVHAQDFLAELRQAEETPGVLRWARDTLQDLQRVPCELRWPQRLSSMAVCLGLEMPAISAACIVGGFGLARVSPALLLLVPLLVLAGLSVAACVWRGGLALHLMGLRVRRNRDGGPASRRRLVLRAVLTWTPAVLANLLYSVFSWLLVSGAARMPMAGILAILEPRVIVILFAASLLQLAYLVGPLVAVLNPPRGIQDVLAGTRLLPR
jgi:uncharacterized RDD family membrane protein YckC